MLETTSGTLTIVDLNSAAQKYFWRGAPLPHVLSLMAHVNANDQRVSVRVRDPAFTDLDQDAQDQLNAIYAEMEAAGIRVLKARERRHGN